MKGGAGNEKGGREYQERKTLLFLLPPFLITGTALFTVTLHALQRAQRRSPSSRLNRRLHLGDRDRLPGDRLDVAARLPESEFPPEREPLLVVRDDLKANLRDAG